MHPFLSLLPSLYFLFTFLLHPIQFHKVEFTSACNESFFFINWIIENSICFVYCLLHVLADDPAYLWGCNRLNRMKILLLLRWKLFHVNWIEWRSEKKLSLMLFCCLMASFSISIFTSILGFIFRLKLYWSW